MGEVYDKNVSLVSPLLFNLYLNEIPNLLKACNSIEPIILPNGSPLSCLFYADDVFLFSSSLCTGLQTSLNIFQQYCKNWKLLLNLKKTKITIFEKRCGKSTLKKYSFFIDNNPFEISQDYSYLGLSVCANGNFLNAKVCVNEGVLALSHLQKLFTIRFRPKHWGDFPSAVFRVLSETHAISLSESPCTALRDQSFWNVSPASWTPDFNRWQWFRILACVKTPPPPFPQEKSEGGAGGGVHTGYRISKPRIPDFTKPTKISWIRE